MKEKVKLLNITFAFLVLVLIHSCEKPNESLVLEFTNEIAEDATAAVLKAVSSIEKNQSAEIHFAPGTYHFYPEKGKEFYTYVSNHDDGLIRTAFPIINLNNILIDGAGATFIFHGKMIPFLIEDSNNIKIKNVKIDWFQTFHSEALVVANDLKNKTFDLKISDKYSYVIRDGALFFIKEYYEHTLGQSVLFDPKRKGVTFNTENYTPTVSYSPVKGGIRGEINYKYEVIRKHNPYFMYQVQNNDYKFEELDFGLVRVYGHSKELPPVGNIIACKGERGTNRIAPAIRILNVKEFFAENVTIHHAGGMGVIAENSENLTLQDCKIVPSNGRMVSTTADATHFVGCRGKVELKNCTFTNQLDDATNIHGAYQEIQDIIDSKTLGVKIGHFQQYNFFLGKPADQIGFVKKSSSLKPFEIAKLESITPQNGGYHILKFSEDLPETIQPGDLLENLDAYPSLLVENCKIANNRARGVLVSTPKKVVVRNNVFSTEMQAILMPNEQTFWYESGGVSDLVIEDNVFQDCVHGGLNQPVIDFRSHNKDRDFAFSNISIRNNTFKSFDNLVLKVNNANNLTFENNTIEETNTFPKLFPNNPVIMVKYSEGLNFNQNTYKGSAKQIFKTDKATMNLTLE